MLFIGQTPISHPFYQLTSAPALSRTNSITRISRYFNLPDPLLFDKIKVGFRILTDFAQCLHSHEIFLDMMSCVWIEWL